MTHRKTIFILSVCIAVLLLPGCGKRKLNYIDGVAYNVREGIAHAIKGDPSCENPVIREKYQDNWVRVIESDVFTDSVMTRITIPSSVENVNGGAFTDCHKLKEVTIQGRASLNKGTFLRCDALEVVDFRNGTAEISMQAFEDCPALREIHLPVNCEKLEGSVPEGVTLYFRSEKLVPAALENNWDFRMEDGSELLRTGLAEAVESGMITVEPDTSSVLELRLSNVSKNLLIVEHPEELEAVIGDRTYYLIGSDASGSFMMKAGDVREVPAEYYTAYGPDGTTVQLAAESRYMTVRLYAGKRELQDEYTIAPFERKDLSLPCGRYSMDILEADTMEDAVPDGSEDESWRAIAHWDFEAGVFYEVSPGLGGGYGVWEREEYGPGTSSLFLRADEDKACYRLVRVGGELEQEILLEPGTKKTISFPCGRYRLRIASGKTWISDADAFGPEGKYSAIDYFRFKEGETYEITTTTGTGTGNVRGDSAGGFGNSK